MRNFLENNVPGTFGFFKDFFGTMSNKTGSQSLRKWLAVGVFWLIAAITLEYTDKDNIVTVLTIHSGTFVSLVITYSVSTHRTKVLESKKDPSKPDAPTDEVPGT